MATGILMKNCKRTGGFSVVEGIVASALVATLALGGLASYNYMRKVRNRSTDICRLHVAGVVEKFRSIGYFAAINNFNPIESTRTFTGNSPTSLADSKGIPNTQLWPNISVLEAAPRPTLNNSVLISSSINALLAIYNSNADFCASSNGAVYTGSGLNSALVTYPSEDLKDATVRLQIVPYDADSGGPLKPTTCPMPLRIAPGPIGPASSAFSSSPPKAKEGDTKYNAGLLVRVIQNFTDEDGQASSCSVEQRFQYSPDLNAPLPPNYATMMPAGTSVGNCAPPNTNVTITFGYDGSRFMEPGAVMVCRDNSITSDTPAPGYAKFACISGPVPQVVGRNFPAPGPLPVNTTGLTYSAGYTTVSGTPGNDWVPCDTVTACGRPPDAGSVSILGGTSTNQPKYRLRYSNLPLGCRVNIEIATLDTASNSSVNFLTAGTAVNPSIPDFSMTRIQFDVSRPTCGTSMCGSCGANCGLTPGNVYFQCPSCP